VTESGYRYDVFVCSIPDRTVGSHDGDCEDWHRIDTFWNASYAKAFELATHQPHARVVCHSMSTGGTRTAFEFVAGGGLCADCRSARGPLISLVTANKFLCDSCRRGCDRARVHLGLSASPDVYLPVISRRSPDENHRREMA